jgi:hypothetical protein
LNLPDREISALYAEKVLVRDRLLERPDAPVENPTHELR